MLSVKSSMFASAVKNSAALAKENDLDDFILRQRVYFYFLLMLEFC